MSKHGPEVRARALALLDDGHSPAGAAFICGVSPPTVRRWARQSGRALLRKPSEAHPWRQFYGLPLSRKPRRPDVTPKTTPSGE